MNQNSLTQYWTDLRLYNIHKRHHVTRINWRDIKINRNFVKAGLNISLSCFIDKFFYINITASGKETDAESAKKEET